MNGDNSMRVRVTDYDAAFAWAQKCGALKPAIDMDAVHDYVMRTGEEPDGFTALRVRETQSGATFEPWGDARGD